MKRFIKFCALTGLVILLAGVGITSVTAALGGRFSDSIPGRLWYSIRYYTDNQDWDDADDPEYGHGWTQWKENDLHTQDAQASSSSPGYNPGPDSSTAATPAAPPGSGSSTAAGPAGGTEAGDNSSGTDMGTTQAFNTTRKLDVDMDQGSLKIVEKQGISQIEVNIKDKFNATRCYMDDGTLKIKREKKRHRADTPKVEILVPSGYVFDKVSVDMGAAECHIEQIQTSKLDIDTGVGAVVFTGTVTGDVELEAGVGDITLNLPGRQEDYNYKIECGVGQIQVGSSHYTMLSHETHVNNNAPHTMDLECGVGSVHVNFDESM